VIVWYQLCVSILPQALKAGKNVDSLVIDLWLQYVEEDAGSARAGYEHFQMDKREGA